MSNITLQLTEMAHGGAALGRDERGQVIFVPFGIPGEEVEVAVEQNKKRYGNGRIRTIRRPSPERVTPRCPHFGVCGGCHFQHIDYEAQLRFKHDVVVDQLARIGGLKRANVRPVLSNPQPYDQRVEAVLSPAGNGRLGYWSPFRREVIPVDTCPILKPQLRELLEDIDIVLPGLRRLTLRIGDDEAMLAAIEVDGVEPPALEADFPISAAIVMPDGTAANLVGDNYIVQTVGGRDFRISAGVFCHPSPDAAWLLVETVLRYATPRGSYVLEGYSGAGLLTAFLADEAASVIGIEQNPDAIEDAAVNLADFDEVYLYEGVVEAILPELEIDPDVIVLDPPENGVAPNAWAALRLLSPERLIYSSRSLATLARDVQQLARAGYRLVELQPIDIFPQHFEVQTVSLWQR